MTAIYLDVECVRERQKKRERGRAREVANVFLWSERIAAVGPMANI